jgi:hypothetical protein
MTRQENKLKTGTGTECGNRVLTVFPFYCVENSFQVRGLEKDTAVLCTPTQTFSLQRAHTSNMLIPVAPLIESRRSDNDTGMDVDMDMDTEIGGSLHADPYYIDDPVLEDSPFGRQAVLDILDSVLDLIPISPRLERLGEILAKSQFEGWAQESDSKVHTFAVFLCV